MSLIDPAVARQAKALEDQRRPRGMGVWIGLLAVGGLWVLCGYGLADTFRYPIGELYLTSDMVPPNDTPTWLWALFVGIFGAVILAIILQPAFVRRWGISVGLGLPMALAQVGTAIGAWRGAQDRWVAAPQPGTFVDSAGQSGDPWGVGAWIAWSLQYWGPALLLVIAVFIVLGFVHGQRTQRRRDARARTVIETGVKTRGVVTEVHDTGVEVLGQPRIRFTVRFTDTDGAERWVTKTRLFDPAQLPRAGDPAVVWFNPADPGDQSSIPVALGASEMVDAVLAGDHDPLAPD